MSRLQFKVKYKATLPDGQRIEGLEEEASWFLIDQRGSFFSHGPMQPVRPCEDEYDELTPLIKIGNRYLSVEEIERIFLDVKLCLDMLPDEQVFSGLVEETKEKVRLD